MSLDAQGERPRGWNWVDIVKVRGHLITDTLL